MTGGHHRTDSLYTAIRWEGDSLHTIIRGEGEGKGLGDTVGPIPSIPPLDGRKIPSIPSLEGRERGRGWGTP